MTEENKSEGTEMHTIEDKFTFVPSPDGIVEIYANLVDANWTLHDVRMRFAQIVPNTRGSEPAFRAEERAAVTVSWGYAKTISQLLADLIRRYEDVNGEIQTPKIAK